MGGTPNNWSEHSQLVLTKLEELQEGDKDIQKALDNVNQKLIKLEAVTDDVKVIEDWKTQVTNTWSPTQMKEAKDQIYKQKEKWTGAMYVFITIQVIWGILIVFKEKLF